MSLFLLSAVSLYYSVLSLFPFLFPCTYSFLLTILLCTVGGLLGDFMGSHLKLRLLCLLLPLSCMIPAANLLDLLTLLPPVIFSCLLLLFTDKAPEYYSYRQYFTYSTIAWGIGVGAFALYGELERLTGNPTTLEVGMSLRYMLLSCIGSVALLRQLRLGAEDNRGKKLSRIQLAGSLGIIGGIVAAMAFLENYAKSHALPFAKLLEKVFFLFYGMILAPFVALWELLTKPVRTAIDYGEDLLGAAEETYETVPMPTGLGGLIPEAVPEEPMGFPWWLVVLILLTMAVLLFLMSRILRLREQKTGSAEVLEKAAKEPTMPKDKRSTNRQKVRSAYRDYLRKMKKSGVSLKKDMTSEDILKKTPKERDIAAAEKLREIYLSARYDDSAKITAQQVKDAQNAQKKV